MARVKVSKDNMSESLLNDITALINKDGKSAYILGQDDSVVQIKNWISTGSFLLDRLISNRKGIGGIPFGRISEISGLEGTSKSLLCALLVAHAQKAHDAVVVYFDTEGATNKEFMEVLGVDTNKMAWVLENQIETIYAKTEQIIEKVKSADKDRKVLIIVDSLANTTTEVEAEADFGIDGYATHKARIHSKAMRKLATMILELDVALFFTNQLRTKLNAQPFSDPWMTPGGKGIDFAASLRLRVSKKDKIQDKDKNVIGVNVIFDVHKSRLGPPHRKIELPLYFAYGFDDVQSWFDFLKKRGHIRSSGPTMILTTRDGTEHKFRSAEWKQYLQTNAELIPEVLDMIEDEIIFKYGSEPPVTEELELTPATDDE